MFYTSLILLISLLFFGLVIFLTKQPFSNIFTTSSIFEQEHKNNVENLSPDSDSHRHTKDTVHIHSTPQLNPQKSSLVRGKGSPRGRAIYPCRQTIVQTVNFGSDNFVGTYNLREYGIQSFPIKVIKHKHKSNLQERIIMWNESIHRPVIPVFIVHSVFERTILEIWLVSL
ncbi:hypothetical protein DdX_14308 [Ditylenchus destructor]|uniref:Uncharacterized protein n=1 Tax=Ditylenchus destructor TaxID=166010 RepID=A0AAD4MSX5_9BILA|nr:hypothetical protein DdX_14308 [Ditylenchus destructor]